MSVVCAAIGSEIVPLRGWRRRLEAVSHTPPASNRRVAGPAVFRPLPCVCGVWVPVQVAGAVQSVLPLPLPLPGTAVRAQGGAQRPPHPSGASVLRRSAALDVCFEAAQGRGECNGVCLWR